MDKEILVEYTDLQAEIKNLRRLIEVTEKKIKKIEEEGEVVDTVKGGMGGIQHFKVSGFPVPEHSKVNTLLKLRKRMLEVKEEELLELTNEAEEYIESIEESKTRNMFRLRYIEGLQWAQVAMQMNNLYPKRKIAYTEESCRQYNKRYFDKI